MTANPMTVPPHASVAEAWDLMRERAVRHLPVVDGGAVVGIVSDRDLAHFDMARLLTAEGAEALRRELGTPVVKVMNADVIAVNPEAELGEVVDLLVENRIGAVPREQGFELLVDHQADHSLHGFAEPSRRSGRRAGDRHGHVAGAVPPRVQRCCTRRHRDCS
jgi:acetoin utilization protein AcuB